MLAGMSVETLAITLCGDVEVVPEGNSSNSHIFQENGQATLLVTEGVIGTFQGYVESNVSKITKCSGGKKGVVKLTFTHMRGMILSDSEPPRLLTGELTIEADGMVIRQVSRAKFDSMMAEV